MTPDHAYDLARARPACRDHAERCLGQGRLAESDRAKYTDIVEDLAIRAAEDYTDPQFAE